MPVTVFHRCHLGGCSLTWGSLNCRALLSQLGPRLMASGLLLFVGGGHLGAAQADDVSPISWIGSFGALGEHTVYNVPQMESSYQKSSQDEEAFLGTAGFRMGPLLLGNFAFTGGYTYRQRWYTDASLLARHRGEPLDAAKQPLPAGLMVREHRWHGMGLLGGLEPWELGFVADLRLRRGGSRAFAEPAALVPSGTYALGERSQLIPWLGYHWTPTQATNLALYHAKEYHYLLPEVSLQTYHWDEADRFVSGILAHSWQADPHLDLALRLGNLRTRANDPWEEFRRLSCMLFLAYTPVNRWSFEGVVGSYSDAYLAPYLVTEPGVPIPSERSRFDSGYLFGLEANYDLSELVVASTGYFYVKNTSPLFKAKEFTRSDVMMTLTVALSHRRESLRPFWLKEDELLLKRLEIDAIK